MPDILCALGWSQLQRLTEMKEARKEVFTRYAAAFRDVADVTLPSQRDYVDPNWHLFPIRVPANKRASIFNLLRNAGFGVQVNYIPAYLHPVFNMSKESIKEFPSSERFYSQEISLPMWPDLLNLKRDIFNEIATVIKEG
jgi:dTDP-4-amino-4,6-dideoxygalactose transaminase